jgi:catechol 2,3-dioxygenase-like lactoylglutathione lyase family enzyme
MDAKATSLTAMVHVQDVQRSADFYRLFGMEVRGSLRDALGGLRWADLVCDQAQLMLARASGPIVARDQAVLFYLYAADLIALRDQLLAKDIKVSAITYPDYMRDGEMRLEDPDGYVILVGQADRRT